MPVTPHNALGLNKLIPPKPVLSQVLGSNLALIKVGTTNVNIQVTKPANKPAKAPVRVPFFQKMPPNVAGANCATAANEIKPMDTNE